VPVHVLEQHTHERPNYIPSTLNEFEFSKPPLTVKECSADVNPINAVGVHGDDFVNAQSAVIQEALSGSGVIVLPSLPVPFEVQPHSSFFSSNWTQYPGNKINSLNRSCILKLRELYLIKKNDKKKRYSAEKAHEILL